MTGDPGEREHLHTIAGGHEVVGEATLELEREQCDLGGAAQWVARSETSGGGGAGSARSLDVQPRNAEFANRAKFVAMDGFQAFVGSNMGLKALQIVGSPAHDQMEAFVGSNSGARKTPLYLPQSG